MIAIGTILKHLLYFGRMQKETSRILPKIWSIIRGDTKNDYVLTENNANTIGRTLFSKENQTENEDASFFQLMKDLFLRGNSKEDVRLILSPEFQEYMASFVSSPCPDIEGGPKSQSRVTAENTMTNAVAVSVESTEENTDPTTSDIHQVSQQ